jgi:hypothetical protein
MDATHNRTERLSVLDLLVDPVLAGPADHYVSRPFAIEEVLGCLRATARRDGTAPGHLITERGPGYPFEP